MKFTPKTQEQLDKENFLNGEHDFEVLFATDKKSKSGNDMIELKLAVFTETGTQLTFHDYLLEAMGHKLLHFCEATDLMTLYLTGALRAQDCVGRAGKLIMGIEKAKNGYPAKNKIVDYVVPGQVEASSVEAQADAAASEPGPGEPF